MAIKRIPKKLNQLGFVARGKSKHRPRNDPSLYGGVYPFIQTGEVKSANLYINSFSQTYSEQGLAQSKLWPQETLLITIAANIAETAILGIEACFPDSIVGFIADPSESDTRFVKYYIDTLKLKMQSISRGTTQDNLSLEKLMLFDFLVPSVDEQKRIASLIGNYDELIENNVRRIKILERMIYDLYREWFTHFRFPNHAEAVGSEAPQSSLPDKWQLSSLQKLCSYINRGISPKYEDTAPCVVINQKCIRNGRLNLELARRNEKAVPQLKFVQFGDILVNSTGEGTLGRVAQVYEDLTNCTVDSHISIVRPSNPIFADYLGITMIEKQEYLATLGEGATNQTELTRTRLGNVDIIVPPKELAMQFSEIVSPLRIQANILAKKNTYLSETRDLLLPRLISGELDISQAENQSETLEQLET